MRWSLTARVFLVGCAAMLPVFMSPLEVYAQGSSGAGLVRAVDVGRNTVWNPRATLRCSSATASAVSSVGSIAAPMNLGERLMISSYNQSL